MKGSPHKSKETRIQEKIVSVILYVLRGLSEEGKADKHSLFKVIYLADKHKLADYGVPIIQDQYIKMSAGPVPSKTRDIIEKAVCNAHSKASYFGQHIHDLIAPSESYFLTAKQAPDMRYLGKVDVHYLDAAIQAIREIGIGPAGMNERTEITHDAAWQSVAELGKPIQTRAILLAGNASAEVIDLFDQHNELESIL